MSTKAQEHKSQITRAIVALLLLFSIAGCKKAGPAEQKYEIDKVSQKGPLTVHVRADKGKITIAQTLLLELETAVNAGYEVNMPKVEGFLKDFGVVDWQNLGNRLDANNNIVSTYRYRLEPFLSGKFAIPAFAFEFHDANQTYQLTTEPIDIEVTSILGQQGELKIEDIEDVVDMPAGSILWWLLAAVVLIFTGAGIWLYFRAKKVIEAVRIFKSAHEIAYNRLDALIKQDLIKQGRVKEFYETISDILRHYIEDRFELRAPERTTEEFLFEIRDAGVLSDSDRKALMEFLTHCDLVKFAKHSPTSEQIQQTFDLAKNFIEQTKSIEKQIDVTDRVETSQLAGGA